MRLPHPWLAGESRAALAKPFTAAGAGFSLNCAGAGEPNERATLERVGLYMARGPLAGQRLSVQGDGLGGLEWKRPFSDGNPHGLFEPEDVIAPLAALVSRPRGHVPGRIR
ncbi:MAG: hypothetical protein GKR94_09645 [Gammaproteobacteria bacterium]|nr:hypothetical protein [Gammaproteobacteria bacterium]